jgi:hypothetical protein
MWYSGVLSPTATNLWRIGHATSPFVPVGIVEREGEVPHDFTLTQNYPNPFNPTTVIRYSLSPNPSPNGRGEGVRVTLKVYDLLGREVATLVNEKKDAGTYSVQWNATKMSSGVYFYTLQAAESRETKRMVLIK